MWFPRRPASPANHPRGSQAPKGLGLVATGAVSPPQADERNPWKGVALFFFLAPKGRRPTFLRPAGAATSFLHLSNGPLRCMLSGLTTVGVVDRLPVMSARKKRATGVPAR